MDEQTYERGREIRAQVLGEAYVAKALADADAFSAPLQDLVTEYCWGAVWGRTFDYGFATGLMVKDIRLYLDEARGLDLPTALADAVAEQWERTLADQGPESDFTTIVKPMERAAGVIVGRQR